MCRENERALLRHDVEVIPVLVQRARMPAAHELPLGLQALARRQAIELSHSRWDHDIELLVAQSRRRAATGPARPLRAERAVIWGMSARPCWPSPPRRCATSARALGWAIVGLGNGSLGGALSGATYMLLEDEGVLGAENMLHGISAAITGAALAKLASGQLSIDRLAGLTGCLLGGILAQQWLSATQATDMVLCETIVTMIALAAVVTPPSTAFAPGRARSLSKT